MGKYDKTVSSKINLAIANELAEMNRLKRLEIKLTSDETDPTIEDLDDQA